MDTELPIGKLPQEKPSRSPLVELKNGKVIFKQKALALEKLSETMQGMLGRVFFTRTLLMNDRCRNCTFQRNVAR